MNLKYIDKNDGYIVARKFANPDELETLNTHTTKGRMTISEVLPIGNTDIEKAVTEHAFDSMKDEVLKTVKKKYFVSDNEIVNFYFEGNVEKDNNNKIYAKYKNYTIPVTQTNFNLDFEVELKVTSKNYFKVQYDNLVYKMNSI